jgi:probable HAF family extracellular repeat protein
MHDLGTLGGSQFDSEAKAINLSGQIVGWSGGTGLTLSHAFLYTGIPGSGGQMQDLGTLGGPSSEARGINDAGQITGFSNIPGNTIHAFLYSGAAMVDLGTLGGDYSFGYAINASGQITGRSTIATGYYHAMKYSGGQMLDLGTLGGTNSEGYAINAFGNVVGLSYLLGNKDNHAFLYTGTPGVDGQMIDLNTWLDAVNPVEGAKWTLFAAYGISDNGLKTT